MNNSDWEIIYKGSLIAIEKHVVKGFERAVRPPGVRLILRNADNQVLLTKEFRHEQGKYDYRLPGGKVVDTLDEYLTIREDKERLIEAVLKAAQIEAKQEAGIDHIDDLSIFFKISSRSERRMGFVLFNRDSERNRGTRTRWR